MGEKAKESIKYVETNVKFSHIQMFFTIEALKIYFQNCKYVKKIDDELGSFCDYCGHSDEVHIYVNLNEEVLEKISPTGGLLEDIMEIYWSRKQDDISGEYFWYLGKYAPCGNHFKDVFEEKKTFDACCCPEFYKEKVCKSIKKITDKVLDIDIKKLVVDNILCEIE